MIKYLTYYTPSSKNASFALTAKVVLLVRYLLAAYLLHVIESTFSQYKFMPLDEENVRSMW